MMDEVLCSCCGCEIEYGAIRAKAELVCADCWDYCCFRDKWRLARLDFEWLPFEPEGPVRGPWRVNELPKHD